MYRYGVYDICGMFPGNTLATVFLLLSFHFQCNGSGSMRIYTWNVWGKKTKQNNWNFTFNFRILFYLNEDFIMQLNEKQNNLNHFKIIFHIFFCVLVNSSLNYLIVTFIHRLVAMPHYSFLYFVSVFVFYTVLSEANLIKGNLSVHLFPLKMRTRAVFLLVFCHFNLYFLFVRVRRKNGITYYCSLWLFVLVLFSSSKTCHSLLVSEF